MTVGAYEFSSLTKIVLMLYSSEILNLAKFYYTFSTLKGIQIKKL